MPKKKKDEPVDPKNLKPEERMKFEIAAELGLAEPDRKGKRPDRRADHKKEAGTGPRKQSLKWKEKSFIMERR